jgi:hypothetical protein
MAETVYVLCTLTSLACAALLFRGYLRTRARLLFWSSLCFLFLSLNNAFLFVDKVVLPEADQLWGVPFVLLRSGTALIGLMLLVIGLVWDAEG